MVVSFFVVLSFLVVSLDFLVDAFLVVSFLVVVEAGAVVDVSVLLVLVQAPIRPAANRTVNE